jgi:hypothetical protein
MIISLYSTGKHCRAHGRTLLDNTWDLCLPSSFQAIQETQALPRVLGFAEGFLLGPWQRKSLPKAALGTTVLTALHPLPRVGPSAGREPRHNQVFAEH